MKYAYSNAAIRVAEKQSEYSQEELMEQAGKALSEAVLSHMERLHLTDVLFVCGGGNNGGDGFVAARLLKDRFDVTALCLAKEFSPLCKTMKDKFGGDILGRIPRRRYQCIVDCLFGTGFSRPLDHENAALVDFINGSDFVIACDVPSGLAENGVTFGTCVRANATVTFGGLKQCLLLSEGADCAGDISVCDLSLHPEEGIELWEEEDIKRLFPKRKSHSNKGDYGTVAVLSTGDMLGACFLSAGAALKSGAGYTDVSLLSSSVPCVNEARLAAFHTEDELHRLLFAAKYPACRFSFYDGEPVFADAVAFGMGAGTGDRTKTILCELLSSYKGTLVLDGDALNTLAVYGVDMLKNKKCSVVVTPHIKEFSRLSGKSVQTILSDPVGCARSFAKEFGVTVVLKNNRTVITDGEKIAINTTGSPALAKGGSGDVLAGFLAGTCARGLSPFEAAVAACYVCGRAGEIAACELGEYAPDASDLVTFLPKAMKF